MLLRYIGAGESVPGLGERRVENGELASVLDEHVAQALLGTRRWERADHVPAPVVEESIAEEPVVEESPKPRTRRYSARKTNAADEDAEAPVVPETLEEKGDDDD